MQQPTLTNVHIRTVEDAHKVFYAVQLGYLPKIERRLDSHERAALRPGNVYVWEEKAPSADNYTVTMERFTEGKSWTASRDFLMYYESTKKKKGEREELPQKARSLENQVVRDGERDLYIKLTYSVYRTDEEAAGSSASTEKDKRKPRKLHLNAYFTKCTEGQLRSIDDIQMLRDLVVPSNLYKTARSTTKSTKKTESGNKSSNSTVQRTYAPFPSSHPRLRAAQIQPAPVATQNMKPEPSGSTSPTSYIPQPYHSHTSLPPIIQPPSHQPSQLPSTHTLPDPYIYQQPASSPTQCLPSPHMQASPMAVSPSSYFSMDQQSVGPYLEPMPDVFSGRNVAGSGSGSSDNASMSSPSPLLSDYSAWTNQTPTPSIHHHHYSLSQQPQYPTHNTDIVMRHTPSLSDSSHSSSSPFSISVAMDDEEDLSSYVPAPPPYDGSDPSLSLRAVTGDGGCARVALAPLHSLQRNHPYRRCSMDDKALRLLGPGAR
ncbi:Gti1/Pac2 family-domain-containing protein [Abortiporus biennis]|nr:Gti1/Pac2 family-domain-containing protein [Abortiporus biennis]